MAVTVACTPTDIRILPKLNYYGGIYPTQKWEYNNYTAGDGSGGSVTFNLTLATSPVSNQYFTINTFMMCEGTPPASTREITLAIASQQWELSRTNGITALQITLPASIKTTNYITNAITNCFPLILGRSIGSATSGISVVNSVNTNLDQYGLYIAGYIYDTYPALIPKYY